MGQGAGLAIEDAFILARKLGDSADMHSALRAYEAARVKRTAWVIRKSRQIGTVAQWVHPLAVKLRNALIKRDSASNQKKRLEAIYDVNFD